MKKHLLTLSALVAASVAANAAEYTINIPTNACAVSGGYTTNWADLPAFGLDFAKVLGTPTPGSSSLTFNTEELFPGWGLTGGWLFFIADVSDYTNITKIELSFDYSAIAPGPGSNSSIAKGEFYNPDTGTGPLANSGSATIVVEKGSTVDVTTAGKYSLIAQGATNINSIVSNGTKIGAGKIISGVSFTFYQDGASLSNIKYTITADAIPEPSMFGLLAGLGALALVGARRRRK